MNLFIIGDGPLSSYLQSIANSNIKFLGHQTNEFVHCALGKCGCLVLPSTYETWGLVVEEALYCGKLCIVSDNCGISALSTSCQNLLVCKPDFLSLKQLLLFVSSRFPIPPHMSESSRNYIDLKDELQLNAYLSLPSF